MNLKDLPFKIGMQYENWEFDLELMDTKNSYEIYKYIKGDINSIDGKKITSILLYFQLDILIRVEITNKSN